MMRCDALRSDARQGKARLGKTACSRAMEGMGVRQGQGLFDVCSVRQARDDSARVEMAWGML